MIISHTSCWAISQLKQLQKLCTRFRVAGLQVRRQQLHIKYNAVETDKITRAKYARMGDPHKILP